MKLAIISMIAIVLCVGAIYAAFLVEEKAKAVKTIVVESPDGMFAVQMQEEPGMDVIVQCHEERFKDAFKHFQRFLGIEGQPLSLPGGPIALAMVPTGVADDLTPAARAAVELLKRHSPRRVILLAHSECLLYDVIAAWENKLEEVKSRQTNDLRTAVAFVKYWLPKAEISVYYAEKRGDKLIFSEMKL